MTSLRVARLDGLDVPAEVIDARLGHVSTVWPGDRTPLRPGLYLLETVLRQGEPFAVTADIRTEHEVEIPDSPVTSPAPSANVPEVFYMRAAHASRAEQTPVPQTLTAALGGTVTGLAQVRLSRATSGAFVVLGEAGAKFVTIHSHPPSPATIAVAADVPGGRSPTMSLDGSSVSAIASHLFERGLVRQGVAILERAPSLDVMDRCMLGFVRRRLGDKQRIDVDALLAEFAGVADVWILGALYARDDGQLAIAGEMLLTALRLETPSLSDALSAMLSSLRDASELGVVLSEEDLARVQGLARLAARADLSRVITTITVRYDHVIDVLQPALPARRQLLLAGLKLSMPARSWSAANTPRALLREARRTLSLFADAQRRRLETEVAQDVDEFRITREQLDVRLREDDIARERAEIAEQLRAELGLPSMDVRKRRVDSGPEEVEA